MRPVLFLASLVLLAAALLRPGLAGLIPFAAALALAGLALLFLGRRRPRPSAVPTRHVVIDGSNVMHWRGDGPDLGPVRAVVEDLARRGFTPGVVFDANAGWKLEGRWLGHRAFARRLALPEDRVLVVPKGTPADVFILAAARDLGASIVTNDRYRDWAEAHPEVTRPGHLIRGGCTNGRVRLDLPADGQPEPEEKQARSKA